MIQIKRKEQAHPETDSRLTDLFSHHLRTQQEHFDLLFEKLRKEREATTVRTTDLSNAQGLAGGVGGVLFPEGIHLPEGLPIGTACIANYGATAKIYVYEGAGAQGRILGVVAPGKLLAVALPDGIAIVSLRTTAADSGTVVVTLTTIRHKPSCSALI